MNQTHCHFNLRMVYKPPCDVTTERISIKEVHSRKDFDFIRRPVIECVSGRSNKDVDYQTCLTKGY